MSVPRSTYGGEYIVEQTQVLFVKVRKKKQKPAILCDLIVTSTTVGLTDPKKSNKTIISYPRHVLVDLKYNKDTTNDICKLELSVLVKNKKHQLRMEFPSEDAVDIRQQFITLFNQDLLKPTTSNNDNNNNNNNHQNANNDNTNNNSNNTANKPTKQTNQTNQTSDKKQSQPQSHSPTKQTHNQLQNGKKRGIKRKRQDKVDDETFLLRAKKLAKHKFLSTLYKQLVIKNVLTASEFWDEYGKDIDVRQSLTGKHCGMDNSVLTNTVHRKQWSLHDICKANNDVDNNNNNNNDGKKTIKLTRHDIIEIFIHLPEVQLCYKYHVPNDYTEQEFWKSFLQSHYFSRKSSQNVSSHNSDKETAMDTKLKYYSKILKQQNDLKANNYDKSMNNKHDNKDNKNSFAKQLSRIQTEKNKEVKAKEAMQEMKENIALAQAKKNSENNKFLEQINSGSITLINNDLMKKLKINIKDDDGDVDMKHNDSNNDDKNEENKPFQKKLNALDPSIDLSSTKDSFTEVIEDLGGDNEENTNFERSDIQKWFKEVNQHSSFILGQSLKKQNNSNNNNDNNHNNRNRHKHKAQIEDIQEVLTDVPRVHYGQKFDNIYDDDDDDVEIVENDDEKQDANNEADDNLNIMNMDYEERLNVETEFSDLREEGSKNYIELKIKDQSVYWGDNLLLTENEQNYLNSEAKQLSNYYLMVKKSTKKQKLHNAETHSVAQNSYIKSTLEKNTNNNYANNAVRLQTENQNKGHNRNKNLNKSNNGKIRQVKANEYMIYTQNGAVPANFKVLNQMSNFSKPLKELVRHYWSCFPADSQKLHKAQILYENIVAYNKQIQHFENKLIKKRKIKHNQYQPALLQPLKSLTKKVMEHHQNIQKEIETKKQNRKSQQTTQTQIETENPTHQK